MGQTKSSRTPVRSDPDFGVRAGYLVHDVSRLRRAFFDSQLRPYGLTRSQWWVLGQLSRRNGQSMSQVELAQHLDVGKAALGVLIDRIEAAGYVRRTSIPGDRRVKMVTITPKGLEVTVLMRKIGHALNVQLFEGLSDAQVHALEETLSRIKTNLIELVSEADGAAAAETKSRRRQTQRDVSSTGSSGGGERVAAKPRARRHKQS
jgi:MarR family transcriptional regulator, transcriptional regulator for hemolysin